MLPDDGSYFGTVWMVFLDERDSFCFCLWTSFVQGGCGIAKDPRGIASIPKAVRHFLKTRIARCGIIHYSADPDIL